MKTKVCPVCNEVFCGIKCPKCGLVVGEESLRIEVTGDDFSVKIPIVCDGGKIGDIMKDKTFEKFRKGGY